MPVKKGLFGIHIAKDNGLFYHCCVHVLSTCHAM